jgi:hypothetical protein
MTEKKSYWTFNNVVGLIGILGFILAFIIAISPFVSPTRANLTIFIDHIVVDMPGGGNPLGFTIFLKIVNDSPKSANIYYWNFSFNMILPYKIVSQSASRNPPLVLTSSTEIDLNMSQTVTGENNTPLSPTLDIKSMLITIQYQDDVGTKETSLIYDHPFS